MNNNESIENLSNYSEDEQWLILLLLLQEIENQNYELWEQFKAQLVYNNRFHSDHEIVHVIKELSNSVTVYQKSGSIYYRARKYNAETYKDKVFNFILKSSGFSEDEIKKLKLDFPDYMRGLLINPNYSFLQRKVNDERSSSLIKAWQKWIKKVRFKGFNGKESTAPPANLVPSGRANPENIRYLYLSESKETTVYEMRPLIGQKLSIAKFKTKKDLKIFDLTCEPYDISNNENYFSRNLFSSIGRMFSVPNDGKETDYIPTQYLVEEIKNMGFDGLRFKSSLHNGGINIVLFNPEDCTAISSDLVVVSDIKISTDAPTLYNIADQF